MKKYVLLFCSVLMGCSDMDRGSFEEASIIAVGDSVFEWHLWTGRSAPERLGQALDRPVYNAAISGALVTDGVEESIPNQYIEGDWDWVIVDGGANDLADLCQCNECTVTQNNIEKTISEFVTDRTAEGQRVVLWSYYVLPDNARFGFENCHDDFDELRQRHKTIADADPNVIWVNGADIISGEKSRHFYADRIHPSRLAAKMIGQQIAQAIEEFEQ